jgi:hypothetical protein
VLRAAGPAVAVGVLVAGAAAIAYVAGAALGAWLVTGRLQARRRSTEAELTG